MKDGLREELLCDSAVVSHHRSRHRLVIRHISDVDFQFMAMFVCFKGCMEVVCWLRDQCVDICRVPHGRSSIL